MTYRSERSERKNFRQFRGVPYSVSPSLQTNVSRMSSNSLSAKTTPFAVSKRLLNAFNRVVYNNPNTDPLNAAFGTVPLDLGQWLVCIAMASGVLWVGELRKLWARAT